MYQTPKGDASLITNQMEDYKCSKVNMEKAGGINKIPQGLYLRKILSIINYTRQTKQFKSCTYVLAQNLMDEGTERWINLYMYFGKNDLKIMQRFKRMF